MGGGESPRQIERAARWAWGLWLSMLAGHGVMLAVAAIALDLGSGGWRGRGFGWAMLGLAIAVIVGTFGRGEVFKRYWVGQAITPRGYLIGHALAWGLLLAAAGGGLAVCLVTGAMWPTATVMLAALAMHALMWPRPEAMGKPE